jgi:hypothetical protein
MQKLNATYSNMKSFNEDKGFGVIYRGIAPKRKLNDLISI